MVPVITAQQMYDAVMQEVAACDIFIGVAVLLIIVVNSLLTKRLQRQRQNLL